MVDAQLQVGIPSIDSEPESKSRTVQLRSSDILVLQSPATYLRSATPKSLFSSICARPATAGSLSEVILSPRPKKSVLIFSQSVRKRSSLLRPKPRAIVRVQVQFSFVRPKRVSTLRKHRSRISFRRNSTSPLGRYHSCKHQARPSTGVESDIDDLWLI